MSGAGEPGRRSFDPAAGLRALADLINDAIAGLGTGAVPATATGPAFPGPVRGPQRSDMAIDVSAAARAARQAATGGTAGQHAAPAGDGPPAPSDGPGSGGDSATQATRAAQADNAAGTGGADAGEPAADGVEREHAEVWRLVELAQQGDGEAFGQLYDRYVDSVFRFIYYRVNDRALAEDFTSETFLRALRRIGTISYQGRDIGAWFVTIARNIVLDHVKSARNRLEVTTADSPEPAHHADSPESAVLTTLTNERLMAAVAQLGDEQRECVLLRFIQGFSVSETAHVMGKNDGAIKALQHRAIRKLAESVGGELL